MGLSDPFDPLQAIPVSARVSLQTISRTLGLAAAAYNAGGRRIEQWVVPPRPIADRGPGLHEDHHRSQGERMNCCIKDGFHAARIAEQAPCEGIGRRRLGK
jgi:hypothetical protein